MTRLFQLTRLLPQATAEVYPPGVPVELTVRFHDGRTLTVPVSADDTAPPEPAEATNPIDADLKPVHRALLEKATSQGQTLKQLVSQTAYPFTSYTREAVGYLLNAGLLKRLPGCLYVRQEKPR